MKSALIALLACLLVLCAQGQRQPKTKCKCLDGAIDHINPKLITDCQGYDSSPFCPKAELIVVTKDTKKCVNPESPFGKRIFQRCKDRVNGVSPNTPSQPAAVTVTSSATPTTSKL
ncbi:C-X-C motif chemokine 6-like [Myripristis murdjan]|uniref:C-X-C motif chemokine 6-like n=1 Tax=Myripristis murdjan TaxID=586833 RepID=UPI00117606D8|nr:C-X-C motif chemokine 6-like [Myripristis murdjan]